MSNYSSSMRAGLRRRQQSSQQRLSQHRRSMSRYRLLTQRLTSGSSEQKRSCPSWSTSQQATYELARLRLARQRKFWRVLLAAWQNAIQTSALPLEFWSCLL